MVFTCVGLCEKLKANRLLKLTYESRYYCSKCKVFYTQGTAIKKLGLRCPCCNCLLRIKNRKKTVKSLEKKFVK